MSKSRALTDADLAERERRKKKKSVLVSYQEMMSMKKEIPILELVTLGFELTSFTAYMLGKLIQPRTKGKGKKNHIKRYESSS